MNLARPFKAGIIVGNQRRVSDARFALQVEHHRRSATIADLPNSTGLERPA
jgi:hypothetical protein